MKTCARTLAHWIAFIALVGAAPAFANGRIVDTAFVAEAMQRGAIIWDARSDDDYKVAHLPGAVNVGDAARVLREENNEDYIALTDIQDILGSAGIDPSKEIVVYGAKAHTGPYFALLTLQYLGADKAYVYHGGIDDWKAAGKELSKEPATPKPVALQLDPRPELLVNTKDVLSRLSDKSAQILDVRAPREYQGEDIRALRGGHIPGALNIAYEQNWADPDTFKKLARKQVKNKDGLNLKSADQLKALYAKLDPNKETIVYCQSGVRASVAATVLREIGFKNVKVYDSSWLGYGNTFDAPVDGLKYFNVGSMNAKLNAMQLRIEELEDQLAQMKAKPQ